MSSCLEVSEREGGAAVSLSLEDDFTLSSSSLKKYFPKSCGLRFRSAVSKTVRGVRCVDGKFYPPEGGWEKCVHFCSGFTKFTKRKATDSASEDAEVCKVKRWDTKPSDLIVLGINKEDTTEEHIRECFEKFGELQLVSIKRDPRGVSKGFGFIRFLTYESQKTLLEDEVDSYLVNGHRCEVKIPLSKMKNKEIENKECKIFVGNFSADLTSLDLRKYFAQFGEVAHVYVPPNQAKPYAFVTFKNYEVVGQLWGKHHIVKGISVNISPAAERIDFQPHPLNGNKRNEQPTTSIQNARLSNEIMSQVQHILASKNAEEFNGLCHSISPGCETLKTSNNQTLKDLLEIFQTHTLPLLAQSAAKVAQDFTMSLANNRALQAPSGLNRGPTVPAEVPQVQEPPVLPQNQLGTRNPEFCKAVGASSDYSKAKMQRGEALGLGITGANCDLSFWRPFYNNVRK